MHWFFLSLIPPLLYAIVNFIDKFLISKYFKDGEVGALILFSSLSGLVVLPVAYIIEPQALVISFLDASLLIISGVLMVIAIIFYLKALFQDDTSNVIPFLQVRPVFGFILGLIFLGEFLTSSQIIASILIILGAILLSIEFKERSFTFKKKIAIAMLSSAFLFSAQEVLFKFVSLDVGFWTGVFWSFVGIFLVGVVIFIFNKSYRDEFINVFKVNSAAVISLNFLNETLTIVGDIILYSILLIAPIALVETAVSTQPVFVLIIGVLISVFFPHSIVRESLERKHVIQKVIAIMLMVIGGILLI